MTAEGEIMGTGCKVCWRRSMILDTEGEQGAIFKAKRENENVSERRYRTAQ